MAFQCPDKYRVKKGEWATNDGDLFGAFFVSRRKEKSPLKIIASGGESGEGWEHVSVSTPTRCPTWDEMCKIKDLFWGNDDTVIQYHPSKSEYINNHPYCLHLWRPTDQEIPSPPSIMVGYK